MGRPRLQLIGLVFGRLLVIKEDKSEKHQASWWLCQCDCGETAICSGRDLNAGSVRSCGCLAWERSHKLGIASRTHNWSRKGNKTYRAWCAMRRRILNVKSPNYEHYGGRGITICKRWSKFENFLADMGQAPKNLSLDRINNDGNYEPNNCRWATAKEQANNRRPPKRKRKENDDTYLLR